MRRFVVGHTYISSTISIIAEYKEDIMAFTPVEFVNVNSVTIPTGESRHFLTIVDGVATFNFAGATNDGFLRDQVTFLVPKEGATNPADPASALQIRVVDITASVFPASALSFGGGPMGWAVDRVDVAPEGQHARITASLAIQGSNTTLFRVGFHVSIVTI
jgi:hypothetical protein